MESDALGPQERYFSKLSAVFTVFIQQNELNQTTDETYLLQMSNMITY